MSMVKICTICPEQSKVSKTLFDNYNTEILINSMQYHLKTDKKQLIYQTGNYNGLHVWNIFFFKDQEWRTCNYRHLLSLHVNPFFQIKTNHLHLK